MSFAYSLRQEQLTILNAKDLINKNGYDTSVVPDKKLTMDDWAVIQQPMNLGFNASEFSSPEEVHKTLLFKNKLRSFLTEENPSLECAINLKGALTEHVRNKADLEFVRNKDGLHLVLIDKYDYFEKKFNMPAPILATYYITIIPPSLEYLSLLAIKYPSINLLEPNH